MKLSDLAILKKLQAERDYLIELRSSLRDAGLRHVASPLKIGKHDVRPDLAAKIAPAIADVLGGAFLENEKALAAIGVTVDDGVRP